MELDQRLEAGQLARRSELLAQFGAEALRHAPLSQLLAAAVECAQRGVSAERVKILEPQEDGSLLVVAGVGWNPGVVGHARLANTMDSAPGRTFLTGEPVAIEDFRTQSTFYLSDLLREHHIVSLVNVPIKSGEVTFGVLEVDSTVPRRWQQHDVDFLRGFANLLTVAIQRNRMEDQRNILMREVQHRVKNNLQLITSMMRISARKAASRETREIIDDLARRVAVVASVYQLLMRSGEMDRVGIRDYLGDLCGKLAMTAGRVRIAAELADRVICIDDAIPLGLITNELVTNSLKHAFPGGDGVVNVSVRPTPDPDWMLLTVADNGRGMGKDIAEGFGTQIVNLLAAQLGGKAFVASTGQGTMIEVRLRLPKADAAP